MLTQLQEFIQNLVHKLDRSELDRFISEKQPTSISEVEFLTREYEHRKESNNDLHYN